MLLTETLPTPETELEAAICSHPDWIDGMMWGVPRPGHPEGLVGIHTLDVLENVERFAADEEQREDLRLIALLHDCRKAFVDGIRGVDHAAAARDFAELFLDDERILIVIEHHDDVFRVWRRFNRDGGVRSRDAERMLGELLSGLREIDALDLYVAFFRCDLMTGDKTPLPYQWLCSQLGLEGDARS